MFATERTSRPSESAMDVPDRAILAQPSHSREAIHDSALARRRPSQGAARPAHNLRHHVTKYGLDGCRNSDDLYPMTMFTMRPGTTITLRTVLPSRCLTTLGTAKACVRISSSPASRAISRLPRILPFT